MLGNWLVHILMSALLTSLVNCLLLVWMTEWLTWWGIVCSMHWWVHNAHDSLMILLNLLSTRWRYCQKLKIYLSTYFIRNNKIFIETSLSIILFCKIPVLFRNPHLISCFSQNIFLLHKVVVKVIKWSWKEVSLIENTRTQYLGGSTRFALSQSLCATSQTSREIFIFNSYSSCHFYT